MGKALDAIEALDTRIAANSAQVHNMEGVLIWSFEHNAWWGPNACGYTTQQSQAGLYDRGRAEEICARANAGRPADSPHEEIRVP